MSTEGASNQQHIAWEPRIRCRSLTAHQHLRSGGNPESKSNPYAQALRETALEGPADQSLASALGLHGLDGAPAAKGAPAEGGAVDRDIALAYMGLRPSGGAGGPQGEGALALALWFRGFRVSWYWPGCWRDFALALSRAQGAAASGHAACALSYVLEGSEVDRDIALAYMGLRPSGGTGGPQGEGARAPTPAGFARHMPCRRLSLPLQVLGADADVESLKCGSVIRAGVRRPVLDALR